MKKIRVGVIGATGMVGQRFISLLEGHECFDVRVVAASSNSAGKTYQEAVAGRWSLSSPLPSEVASLTVRSVVEDIKSIAQDVDLIFSALNMDKTEIMRIEENYADAGVAVVSNNSAHRWTKDIPVVIPEVNAEHIQLIDAQRKNRGWSSGFIAVKPNCSIQSYVCALTALKEFEPLDVSVTSLQAISGAGRTFETWPEMIDNVTPFISGEEEKTIAEPMKIWGVLKQDYIQQATLPNIQATCIRVPVTDGHMAVVNVRFRHTPTKQQFITALEGYKGEVGKLHLPSAPNQLIQYIEAEDRPQTKLDRNYQNGMGISVGRFRQIDKDCHFVSLSHNTVRGAAGGAILLAELLVKTGYVE